MKKVLTVLLVIAVMFTFSFGSAFAATNYTASDYATALSAEMNNQLTYLDNAKVKYLNDLSYNNLGYTASTALADDVISGYTRAAIEAGLDAAIASLTTAMQNAISTASNAVPSAGTTTAPDLAVVKNAAVNDVTDAMNGKTVAEAIANMSDVQTLEVAEIEKAQAPITKAAVEAKLDAVDYSKYNTTDKDYTVGSQKVTAAEYVQSLADTATDTIDAAATDSKKSDAEKRVAYENAYTTFKTAFDAVATLEDEAQLDNEGTKTVAGEVSDYLQYGIKTVYPAVKLVPTSDSSVYELQSATKSVILANDSFYTAKNSTSKAKLFGVEIANIDRITKAEALAVNDAIYKAITDSAAVVTKYAGKDATKVAPLWNSDVNTFLNTLGNAMDVAEVYADVVELGNEMKAEVNYGVKVYDDEKVDEAVKEAEDLVYGDLNGTLKTAEAYINLATASLGYADLKAVNYEYDKFMKAIEDAQKKFYSDVAKKTAQVKVLYGDDKTAEADYVYLQGTYANDKDTVKAWKDIADEAIDALANAESYADIDAALAAAKEDLSELLLKDDATDVKDARSKYCNALSKYVAEYQAILGSDKSDYSDQAWKDVLADGKDLINDATTVAGVEVAYADAQALVKAIKTKDELKAEKNAVIAAITALPVKANLTAADKDTVMKVFDAYQAYVETPGTAVSDITNKAILEEDMVKVLDAERDALTDKIKDAKDAIDDLYVNSDADAKAIADMRAELEELVAAVDAFNDTLDDIKDVEEFDALNVQAIDNTYIEALLDSEAKVWNAEYRAARVLAVAAAKSTATAAERTAALDAYKALTDRQQYAMDASYLELIKRVQEYAIGDVEALKITAKSTAKKGSITVKWTVKGDASIDGFEIWKSTKQSKGYKKAFTTTKQTYKNTKGLTKGTRYYYKVRAYKMVDGVKYTSDWSNKAYRVAK